MQPWQSFQGLHYDASFAALIRMSEYYLRIGKCSFLWPKASNLAYLSDLECQINKLLDPGLIIKTYRKTMPSFHF